MWPKSIITWKYNGYNGPEFGFIFFWMNEWNKCILCLTPLLFSDWTWGLFLAEGGFPECDGLVGYDKEMFLFIFLLKNFVGNFINIFVGNLINIFVGNLMGESNDLVGND